MFYSYLERMPLVKAERMMDMGQASIYSQLTSEGRRTMWNSWNSVVSIINAHMVHTDAKTKNPITWNGQKISIRGLIRKFGERWGKDAVK